MKKIECLAEIAVQGDEALFFIDSSSNKAIYEVIGFDEPKIIIIDYREKGINAINSLLKTNNARDFAPVFNTPALVTLQEEEDGSMLIELNEPLNDPIEKMLWIAIGIQDSIPIYEYFFERIAPLSDNTFAFIALFEIPNLEHQFFETLTFHNQS